MLNKLHSPTIKSRKMQSMLLRTSTSKKVMLQGFRLYSLNHRHGEVERTGKIRKQANFVMAVSLGKCF